MSSKLLVLPRPPGLEVANLPKFKVLYAQPWRSTGSPDCWNMGLFYLGKVHGVVPLAYPCPGGGRLARVSTQTKSVFNPYKILTQWPGKVRKITTLEVV